MNDIILFRKKQPMKSAELCWRKENVLITEVELMCCNRQLLEQRNQRSAACHKADMVVHRIHVVHRCQ